MSKQTWIGIIVIIIIAIGGYYYSQNSKPTPVAGEPFKIGIVAPLTGPGAVFGNALVKGMEMAKEDLGKTKNTYEFVIEDDGSNSGQSASAAQKLINIDKVKAIITTTAGTGNAVKPIAVSAKIPHICICSDSSVADAGYNFTNSLLPEEETSGWVVEASKRNIKTIAMLTQIQPGINAIADALKVKAEAEGMKIVYAERFAPETKDFRTMIGKAQAIKPDIYFVLSFPPSLDIIGQQLADLKVQNISSAAAFAISAKPELFEGKWFTDGAVKDISFRKRFEAKYPDIRFNVRTAPYGYDTFNMLVQGFEKGGDIVSYLHDLDSYSGQVGKINQLGSNGNFRSDPVLWIMKNGKAELVNN